MILPVLPERPLEPVERFGLAVLLDQSRLLVMEGGAPDAVRLRIEEAGSPGEDVAVVRAEAPRTGEGEVRLSRAALRASGRLAGAVAEQETVAEDRFGRVPSAENPLVRAGCADQPVVSLLAVRLRRAVLSAAGARPVRLLAPWPGGRRWAACLTSDLDLVTGWPAATALRLAELARHGAAGRIPGVLRAAARGSLRDPVRHAALRLLGELRRRRFRVTWFVIAGSPGPRSWLRGDVTYRAEGSGARRLIEAVLADGHEVGLHGSFGTALDGKRLRAERERLERVTGRRVAGGRQHFLRMRPGATQQGMAAAGLAYDATYGFPDRNGFRLGSADILPGWDAGRSAPTALSEVPLIWMDRAQSKYSGVEDPEQWVAEGLALAARCRETEGLWTGLWHPNLDPALGFPGAERALVTLLDGLAGGEPWVAPLGELVRWRERRRDARGTSVLGDGTAVVRGEAVALEDQAGRPVPHRNAGSGA